MIKEKEMSREEYQKVFNLLIKEVSELLEVSGNDYLVKNIKKKLFDFSDKIMGDRDYDRAKPE